MSNIPGPRTSPTVKSMVSSNQRDLRSWQLLLGPFQIAAILGVVAGCMTLAFYLGFYSGQKFGIDTALGSNLANVVRIPVDSDSEEVANENAGLPEIYGKLNDQELETGKPHSAKGKTESAGFLMNVVETGQSKESSSEKKPQQAGSAMKMQAPHSESNNEAKPAAGKSLAGEVDATESLNARIRVLGEGNRSGGAQVNTKVSESAAKTLGALAKEAARAEDTGQGAESSAPIAAKAEAPIAAQPAKIAQASVSSAKASGQADAGKISAVKTPLAKSTRAEQPVVVAKSVSKGWYAQIAAPQTQREAEAIAKGLRQSGFPVVIESVRIRKQEYFRVLAGPETSRQQANRLLAQLKREPDLKADPFLRMVK